MLTWNRKERETKDFSDVETWWRQTIDRINERRSAKSYALRERLKTWRQGLHFQSSSFSNSAIFPLYSHKPPYIAFTCINLKKIKFGKFYIHINIHPENNCTAFWKEYIYILENTINFTSNFLKTSNLSSKLSLLRNFFQLFRRVSLN